MLISIPDDLALEYQKQSGPSVPLNKVIERQLRRCLRAKVNQPVLLLSDETLPEIQALLGMGSTQSPQALLDAIRSWAGITIGDIRLEFTPAQLAEIAHRADKQGKEPAAIVADIVQQMQHNFFMDAVVAR